MTFSFIKWLGHGDNSPFFFTNHFHLQSTLLVSSFTSYSCTSPALLPHYQATYYGLFPRAWTSYEPLPGLRLSCKQVSPVVPHDYATSSVPAAVFVWTVENVSKQPLDVSMMFTFQNGDGGPGDSGGGHRNSAFATAPEAGGGASSTSAGAKAGAAEEKKDAAPGDGGKVVGVALAHMHRQRRVFNPEVPSLQNLLFTPLLDPLVCLPR